MISNQQCNKFLNESKTVKDICRPLFCGTCVTSFGYIKIINESKIVYLSSSPDWLEYFFRSEYQHYMTASYIPEIFHYKYVIGSSLKFQKIIIEAEEKFGLSHVFSINNLYKSENEVFIFTTEKKNIGVENWYINNAQYLNQFCIYFKSSIECLEKKFSPILICKSNIIEDEREVQFSSDQYLDDKILLPKKIALSTMSGENYITEHELQCLKLIFQGKTAREISKILCRSVRTIETHIQNVKRKLNCSKRSELIQRIVDNKLHYFFIKI